MVHRALMILAVVVGLSAVNALARGQQAPSRARGDDPKSNVSPYVGRAVSDPESFSGLWEAANGHGGAVGIHLLLSTTVPATTRTLKGIPQSWESLEVGVYERKGAVIQFGEQNYFADSSRGSNVRFDDGRLTLHFPGDPAIHLDLLQQSDKVWVGRFHRGAFDSKVTLRRPRVRDAAKENPIVGTWVGTSRVSNMCIHVFQQAESEFTGWSDGLQVGDPGMERAGLRTAFEHYGDLAKVGFDANGNVIFELHAFTGICCSHKYVGKLHPDGNLIDGAWPPGPNQAPRNDSLRKMPGDSCVE